MLHQCVQFHAYSVFLSTQVHDTRGLYVSKLRRRMRLIKVYVACSLDPRTCQNPATNGVVPRYHTGMHIGDNKVIVMATNAHVGPNIAVSHHRPILIRFMHVELKVISMFMFRCQLPVLCSIFICRHMAMDIPI